MKVILAKSVNNLGARGAIIDIADGYARNFLLPRGLAFEYSESRAQKLLQEIERAAQRAEQVAADSGEAAKKLSGRTFELTVKASASGSLYSAVHFSEIADLIKARTKTTVFPRELSSKHPLKHLGKFELSFRRGVDRADFNLILTR